MTPLAFDTAGAAQAASVTEKQIRAWIGMGLLKAKRQTPLKDDKGRTIGGTGKFLITAKALESCLDSLPDG